MALLSIIVRQAQYSGDRNITSQYCTYVTLTLDRCRATTVTVKGHNPHWEQDYLFETQNTSRGLLIQVWKEEEFEHTSIGCYWLPLSMIRYSNEHTTGLWTSLGSELFLENGVIVKSINATGHFLLYDARFEDPDDRQIEHHSKVIVEDQYQPSVCRRTIECLPSNGMPASVCADNSEEWHRYENSQDADGYRSSSSENVRSDLDYSYSETSNQMDRRSCYESSEKSVENNSRYSQEYKSTYYGDSSYDQSDALNDQSRGYSKQNDYEGQGDENDQWASDEYTEEQTDEVYLNNRDYRLEEDYSYNSRSKSSSYKFNEKKAPACYNSNSKYVDEEDVEMEEDDDIDYYEDNTSPISDEPVVSPPVVKRKLPHIPTVIGGVSKYKSNSSYLYDQKGLSNGYPRVPSIFVDSPTLSPCLSAGKGTTTFNYHDQQQNSDDSASTYHYSNRSTTSKRSQKPLYTSGPVPNRHFNTNTTQRFSPRLPRKIYDDDDDFACEDDDDEDVDEEDEVDEYEGDDYYDYDDDVRSDEDHHVDDDINNNSLKNGRSSAVDYTGKLCSPFREAAAATTAGKIGSRTEINNRRNLYQSRTSNSGRSGADTFGDLFEWSFNELPDDDFEDDRLSPHLTAQPDSQRSPAVTPITRQGSKTQMGSFYSQQVPGFSQQQPQDYHDDDDDVTLMSPVNSSSLSHRSLSYVSQPERKSRDEYQKDGTVAPPGSPYREDTVRSSSITENAISNLPEGYRSPYKKLSLVEMQPSLTTLEGDGPKSEDDHHLPDDFMEKLDVLASKPESRKPSLKEENSAEKRRLIVKNRWLNAYDKIIHQLNVSTYLFMNSILVASIKFSHFNEIPSLRLHTFFCTSVFPEYILQS